jgi:ribosome maturation factor RimP
MWLKTKIGKRVNIKSTKENTEWEGTLVEVDAIGFTINDVESGLTFIPFNNVFAVRVLEL